MADYKSAAQRGRADVAQLAEQLICNQQVIGSSPIIGFPLFGPLAQLVSATGSKPVGPGFESPMVHLVVEKLRYICYNM